LRPSVFFGLAIPVSCFCGDFSSGVAIMSPCC
jgi:hypothetical protein